MSQWYLVKLELAPTEEFPNGSPGRAYLLRVPLDCAARVDGATLSAIPRAAFVRRFWPNEPDSSGFLVRNSGDWAIEYLQPGAGSAAHLEDGRIEVGSILHMSDRDGAPLPFRVVSVTPD